MSEWKVNVYTDSLFFVGGALGWAKYEISSLVIIIPLITY